VAVAACRGVVKVFVDWWWRGERAATAAAVGVPWSCWGRRRSNARKAALLGWEGGSGRAAVLAGRRWGVGGGEG